MKIIVQKQLVWCIAFLANGPSAVAKILKEDVPVRGPPLSNEPWLALRLPPASPFDNFLRAARGRENNYFVLRRELKKMKLLLCYIVLLLSPIVIAIADLQQRQPYNMSGIIPAVFVFGDSVVDTGNNNWIPTVVRANTPQYGKNFKGGIGNGRFCDGKVPSDLFVELLGIKEILPPYLDPRLQAKDLITGVTFASSASGYDPETGALLSILSIQEQIELFKEYIGKLKAIVGEAKALEILSNSLFIVFSGHNDIQLNPASVLNPSYTDLMVKFASNFLQELYKLGARRIGVFGVLPIGCLPFHRNTQGGILKNCVDSLNKKAYSFNNKISTEIKSLSNKFPDAKMVYIDSYNFTFDLINNPTKYGYKFTKNGCCALGGKIELLVSCPIACSNDNEYVFWDGFHFTEKSYRLLVNQVLSMTSSEQLEARPMHAMQLHLS